jgi:hypothetical protein
MNGHNEHILHKEMDHTEEIEKNLNENFDWDWIFDREWLRTKK